MDENIGKAVTKWHTNKVGREGYTGENAIQKFQKIFWTMMTG